MFTETILSAALFATGGVAVNESPADYYEGISGCAAYSEVMDQRACVGRVHYAWTGQTIEEASEVHYATKSAENVPGEVVAPKTTARPVESHTEAGQWVEPDWCHDWSVDPEDLDFTDWEYVTEDWTDEQVALCF